jgi:hypothetical protein
MGACDQHLRPGGLIALTVRQNAQILREGVCAGFLARKMPVSQVQSVWVCFGEQRQQRIGRNFQGVIPTQFLAKPGAGRAQLGVFGRSGAIEAIHFSF